MTQSYFSVDVEHEAKQYQDVEYIVGDQAEHVYCTQNESESNMSRLMLFKNPQPKLLASSRITFQGIEMRYLSQFLWDVLESQKQVNFHSMCFIFITVASIIFFGPRLTDRAQ